MRGRRVSDCLCVEGLVYKYCANRLGYAAVADFAILFTENYARNMLLTLPIWLPALVCFMLVGKQDKGKK